MIMSFQHFDTRKMFVTIVFQYYRAFNWIIFVYPIKFNYGFDHIMLSMLYDTVSLSQ